MDVAGKSKVPEKLDESDDAIFALDIGTRSVVGIIAEGDPLTVTAAYVLEHNERSMQDGQIHDVEKVAKVVSEVKANLEEQIGHELTHVAVAVAGRALKTVQVEAAIERPFGEVSASDAIELEFEALGRARENIDKKDNFNCVGYSVIHYELDGNKLSNIVGQKGQLISVDLLATFLPDAVVDSMFSVLRSVGLKATSLSLEPIAALNVAIPEDMRKLNLALVDIGAGTSDIAITRDGTVVGYGMVPEAGDEITDIICDHYLIDFYKAEQIKRSLTSTETIEMEDIFGTTTLIPVSDVISVIKKDVDSLAAKIAETILSINEKTPRAVVCVGGGSQTVLLKEAIGKHLEVSSKRVGTRLPDVIDSIVDGTGIVTGPDMITPLGIALTAHRELGIQFIDVEVNGERVHMMNVNGLSVMDALASARIKRLYARPGLALSLTVNSSFMTIGGGFGTRGEVVLNGNENENENDNDKLANIANIGDAIEDGDKITFTPPVDGEDAQITALELADRLGMAPVNVLLNGVRTVLDPEMELNGSAVAIGDSNNSINIPDRAEITIRPVMVRDAMKLVGMDDGNDNDNHNHNNTEQIAVTVNNAVRYLGKNHCDIQINGTTMDPDDLDHVLNDNDTVDLGSAPYLYCVKDVVGSPKDGVDMTVILNGKNVTFKGTKHAIKINGHRAAYFDEIKDGDTIIVEDGKDAEPTMSDVLEYMEIKREELVGKTIRMSVNKEAARFTTPLENNCHVSVDFKKM